jgi:MFS family permease
LEKLKNLNIDTKPQSSKEYFHALQIIYFALIAGQVLFGLLTFYLIQSGLFDGDQKDLRNIFIYIVPVFVVGGIFGSHIMFKKVLNEAKRKPSLYEKISAYRSALIVRYALLEGPSFFGIVVFLITGDYLFLGMNGLIIAVFFTLMPTVNRAVNDLELSANDTHTINDPNGVIAELKPEK